MTRFIINSKMAVNLIFNAIKYSIGGEIFVPRLPSFRIIDLIELLKEKENSNVKIKKISVMPGEKIHALLINSSEISRTYRFKDMYVIPSEIDKLPHAKPAKYMVPSRLLNHQLLSEYNSKNEVIEKDQLRSLFKKWNLL